MRNSTEIVPNLAEHAVLVLMLFNQRQRGEAGAAAFPCGTGRSPQFQLPGPMFPGGKDLAVWAAEFPLGGTPLLAWESDQQAPPLPVPDCH